MFYTKLSSNKTDQFMAALDTLKNSFRRTFAADNMIAFDRNQTYLKDDAFMRAFNACAGNAQETSLIWRLHTLAWAARHSLNLEGDFVECGVYKGFSMSVIAHMLDFNQVDKTMYLFDTFEGIPDEYNSENRPSSHWAQVPDLHNQVLAKFVDFENVKVVKGIVPLIFAEVCPEKIAFLHIDMNSSKSEMDALDAIFDRVVPGGIIIFDDFGWLAYNKQTWAQVEFMNERNYMILEIPTGQGVLLKR